MALRVTQGELDWILSSHDTLPFDIFATRECGNPFVTAGTRITGEVVEGLQNKLEMSGEPYLDISDDELSALLTDSYYVKDRQAEIILNEAYGFIASVFNDELDCISDEIFQDLVQFHRKNSVCDPLLANSLVSVMQFRKEKAYHIVNDYFLSLFFYDYCNLHLSSNPDIQSLWPGILLHDVGKQERFFDLQKKYEFKIIDFDKLKNHTSAGLKIIRNANSVKIPPESEQLVYYHHIRPDPAASYPDLKPGEVVPNFVHVFSMVDMYEQMRAKIVHGSKWTQSYVLKQLESDAADGKIHRKMWETFKAFLLEYDRNAVKLLSRPKIGLTD